ncbi:DUF1552 domain-containing protein [Pedosphaera parvula]|uniref:Secreted protein containing DUF1552 n=1 Tax=Pedosphaera parvula (strain Ellin514) TaxID=320771 RepID=B9XP90_PEDPL|nr:DUF1552 domain-containing protein [Pedosphaera parvula]EEF58341.1 protein of unknown function DUF1552 [Pedosphaera parvula Ellin514]
MSNRWHIPRRRFLRGLGTVIALPLLESMAPAAKALGAVSADGRALPKRMAFVYVPNGMNMADWTPSAIGSDFDLPATLEPLKPFQKDMLVLSGLAQHNGEALGDGAGDHARASASFLTGCHPKKTGGADIKVGISADQIAAEKVGRGTRLASLELGLDRGQTSGNCDSGYSCAYQYNISWKTESTPMPPEVDPRLVFERLFSNGYQGESEESRVLRSRYQKSILDFVLDDAKQLKRNLGYTDRHKLDEYMVAIRELEQRIEGAEKDVAALPDFKRPIGIPKDFEEHSQLMFDLLALAFQTDTTRVATYLVAHDGSNNSYPQIGITEGHHELSHHDHSEEKIRKIAKINRYHMAQFAKFIEKLKSTPEGDGSLLDNCMIVYGGGIADGNQHAHYDLPILMMGKGGGTIKTGRHVKVDQYTPLNNLYVSMLDRMGVHAEKIGDSNGKLVQLS